MNIDIIIEHTNKSLLVSLICYYKYDSQSYQR